MGRLREAWRALNAPRTESPLHPDSPRVIMIPDRTGGVLVTPDTAIQISAVYACLSVISKAIASSDWDVFEQQSDGQRNFRNNSRLWRLLNVRPNPEMTAFCFRESMLISAGLYQGGYAEIERDVIGRAVALWPLHPQRITLERIDGDLVYRVHNERREDSFLQKENVFHIHGPSIEGLVGLEVAKIAARGLGHSIASEAFGAAFYANGMNLGAVLSTEGNLPETQKTELLKQLEEKYNGPNRGNKTLVLWGGMKWEQMAIEPEKAQFIETRQHLVEEVARWFGVPPHKIGHLLRATFNNIEHQSIEFARDALVPWGERLRQEADNKLAPAMSIRTRIDLDWLQEGDAKTKAEADGILVEKGIMSRDEIRVRRGLNTRGSKADELTVQAQMVDIEDMGATPPPATTPTPPTPDDGETVPEPTTAAMLREVA